MFVRVAQEKPKTDHGAEGVGLAMPTVADPQAASRWGVMSPQSRPRYSGATGRFLMVFLCNSTLLVFSVTQGSKKAEKRVPVTCVLETICFSFRATHETSCDQTVLTCSGRERRAAELVEADLAMAISRAAVSFNAPSRS